MDEHAETPNQPPVLGARRHKVGCMCRMCIRIREVWSKGQENRRQGKPARVSGSRLRRQRFVQALTDPDRPETFASPSKAALAAGYAAGTGSQLLRDQQTRTAIQAAMEAVGITSRYRAEKLKELLEATYTWRHFDRDRGEVIERKDPDYHTQQKALELAMRGAGDFPRDENVAQAALILRLPDRQLSVDEWNQREAGEAAKRQAEELLYQRIRREGSPRGVEELSRWRRESEEEAAQLQAAQHPELPAMHCGESEK